MKKSILLLCLLALPLGLRAQDAPAAAPTPPPLPLLRRAPVNVQWTITYELKPTGKTSSNLLQGAKASKREDKEKAASPQKTTVVIKDQKLVLEKTTNQAGSIVETWHVAGSQVTAVDGKGWVVAPLGGESFEMPNYVNEDFAGFDWLSQKNFTGVEDVMGSRCLVFKDKVVTVSAAELAVLQQVERMDAFAQMLAKTTAVAKKESNGKTTAAIEEPVLDFKFDVDKHKMDAIAYIDDKTRLPIALVYNVSSGTITRVYRFQSSPALTLPPEVESVLDSVLKQIKRMSVAHAPV